jgi:chromatin remodeling complex protein RSC6
MEEVTMVKVKTIDDNYDNLKAVILALDQDYEKFKTKKVKVAGARVRNNLLNCKKLCDTLRKQVLAQIKEIPIKHRSSKSSDDEEEEKVENPSEREIMEVAGELEPVITKPKRKRRANKVKTKEIKTE